MVSHIFGFNGSPPPPSDYDPEEYHRPTYPPSPSVASSDYSGKESESDMLLDEKRDLLNQIDEALSNLEKGFELRDIEEIGGLAEALEEVHAKLEKRQQKKRKRERKLLKRRKKLRAAMGLPPELSAEESKKRKRADVEPPEELRKPLWMTWREWNGMDNEERDGIVYGLAHSVPTNSTKPASPPRIFSSIDNFDEDDTLVAAASASSMSSDESSGDEAALPAAAKKPRIKPIISYMDSLLIEKDQLLQKLDEAQVKMATHFTDENMLRFESIFKEVKIVQSKLHWHVHGMYKEYLEEWWEWNDSGVKWPNREHNTFDPTSKDPEKNGQDGLIKPERVEPAGWDIFDANYKRAIIRKVEINETDIGIRAAFECKKCREYVYECKFSRLGKGHDLGRCGRCVVPGIPCADGVRRFDANGREVTAETAESDILNVARTSPIPGTGWLAQLGEEQRLAKVHAERMRKEALASAKTSESAPPLSTVQQSSSASAGPGLGEKKRAQQSIQTGQTRPSAISKTAWKKMRRRAKRESAVSGRMFNATAAV